MMREQWQLTCQVNGRPVTAVVPVRRLLSDFLRDDLGLTGTHVGCEQGVCGACTVLVDGEPVRACLTLAAQVDGHAVETVEGLAEPNGPLHPVQAAFHRHHALQCGFCTPGILMTVTAAYRRGGPHTAEEVMALLENHLCRCTGYVHLRRAVAEVLGVEASS